MLTYGGPPQDKMDEEDEDMDRKPREGENSNGAENDVETVSKTSEPLELIDGRPKWYDPIFTRIFANLKEKYSQRFPDNGKKVLGLHKNVDDSSIEFIDANYNSLEDAHWLLRESVPCPVDCGGGKKNKSYV